MQIDTTAITIGSVIVFVIVLLIVILFVLFLLFRNIRGNLSFYTVLQPEIRIIGERIEKVENNQGSVNQGVNSLGSEIRALCERVATVEKNQNMINQGVGYLATNTISRITELKTLTSGLSDSTGAMRAELSRAKNDLTELHSHIKSGQDIERQIADSIYRLETIIAGTQSKGVAGENLLEIVFAKLPVEWQARNFRIGGKIVEFALRLPNNLILPIDSKWAATNLVEQFIQTEDIQEQQQLKKSIEDVIIQKAREVRKYIEPSITVNFGVAVIPDAVYDLCSRVQSEAFQLGVVLVSYSMFVPYLLLVFQTILKNSQSIDLQKLLAYLQTAQESVTSLQDELDGRFSRAITMMNNSRDDMRAILSRLNTSLTGLQLGTGNQLELPSG